MRPAPPGVPSNMSVDSSPDGSPRTAEDSLLAVRGLKKHFPVNTGLFSSLTLDSSGRFPLGIDDTSVKAVDGVSFALERGETFGVVGESGCGKSTLARTILGLEEPTSGDIYFDGRLREEIPESEFHERTQMVFQDPDGSLNGRRKVGKIIEDPLQGSGWDQQRRRERAMELLDQVGLKRQYYDRYPHEFSGGQRQRINLARALSISPDLVVADEPVSGLDVSVQAQILNLMDDLQEEFGLTYLVISHDLSVVRYIADRVAVMYLGDFVEVAPAARLFAEQYHPYARALLSAVPHPNPDMPGASSEISGTVPSASDPPRGCKFHTRCPSFIYPEGFEAAAYERYEALLEAVRERRLPDEDTTQAILDRHDGNRVPEAVRRSAEQAVEQAREGDWKRAAETLAEHESVCQQAAPPLETVGHPEHTAACHLHPEGGDEP